ncbi:hypothetical protein Tco_0435345 [Tanacetum coccineum]
MSSFSKELESFHFSRFLAICNVKLQLNRSKTSSSNCGGVLDEIRSKKSGDLFTENSKDLQADVSICKRFMASGEGNTSNIPPKVKVPKASPFMGKREARAVNDFLWGWSNTWRVST